MLIALRCPTICVCWIPTGADLSFVVRAARDTPAKTSGVRPVDTGGARPVNAGGARDKPAKTS